MLDEPYKVVEIPKTLDAPEHRGARTKYWVRIGQDPERWLLKIPRLGTGEHWAEKVTAEVGSLIGVDCAEVELARFGDHAELTRGNVGVGDDGRGRGEEANYLGTICKSFTPDERNGDEQLLFAFHGVGVLQFVIDGYDTARRFGQKEHNIKNIAAAMAEVLEVNMENPMPQWHPSMEKLASYVLLDGLVANTDRHHENWMIGYVRDLDDVHVEVMPSFDHASSLGRELTDENRRRILESDGVRRYLERGKGGLYVNNRRRRAPSPLRLARLLRRWQPELTESTMNRIDGLSELATRRAIAKVPPEFMSDIAREFAFQVIMTSKHELLRGAR